jgi:hypothetical protein
MYRPLSSLVPNAADLLALEAEQLGGVLLTHLKSYEGLSGNSIYQGGKISQHNFFNSLTLTNANQKPEYGEKQPEVNQALMEAWAWLESKGFLIRDPSQPSPWFFISRSGEELLKQNARFEQWEKLGLDRVKSDLTNTGGMRDIGGPPDVRELAWKWVQMKEAQATAIARLNAAGSRLTLIADTWLTELRALTSSQFDLKKLIRLCEEINTVYSEGCYFATAMLTRGLLDHVPPIFGKNTFSEVANNYAGGGKSFKDAMHHLENAARKVADAHLHMPIRKSETLPTAQQVNFASQVDVLLSEIVRITQ